MIFRCSLTASSPTASSLTALRLTALRLTALRPTASSPTASSATASSATASSPTALRRPSALIVRASRLPLLSLILSFMLLVGCAGDAPTPVATGTVGTGTPTTGTATTGTAAAASSAAPTSPVAGSTLAGESFNPTDTPEPTATAEMAAEAAPAGTMGCIASRDDGLGPNYEPSAPGRTSVGSGYTLEGVVLEAGTCRALSNAVVEVWMAGPDGVYTDDYRATVPVDDRGAFRFESHRPAGYGRQTAHIHLRVSAPGHAPVAIRHLVAAESTSGTVAAVLARQ